MPHLPGVRIPYPDRAVTRPGHQPGRAVRDLVHPAPMTTEGAQWIAGRRFADEHPTVVAAHGEDSSIWAVRHRFRQPDGLVVESGLDADRLRCHLDFYLIIGVRAGCDGRAVQLGCAVRDAGRVDDRGPVPSA